MTTPVSIYEVEPGPLYRFTLRRPPFAGTRKRIVEGVLGASLWGEVPLHTTDGTIRVQRSDIVRVCACR